jgi:putative PIN family toxin of toxin-antitoxin system
MPPRKQRIPVVFDTNIVVGHHITHSAESPNRRVYRLWRDQREMQLIVSDEVTAEYFEVLERLNVATARIARLKQRLQRRETVTHVTPGPRFTDSRDPDDNVMLAAAVAGRAKYLITNDRDLLDIPRDRKRRFCFEIATPQQFLERFDS